VFASAAATRSANASPLTPSASEITRQEAAGAGLNAPLESLASNMRNHILTALEQAGWVIDGPRGAAKILGLHPNTLRSRMKKLGIVRAPPIQNLDA
jgi:transcriptional regulator with GAF, ATPase, and Fis domain